MFTFPMSLSNRKIQIVKQAQLLKETVNTWSADVSNPGYIMVADVLHKMAVFTIS